MSQFELSSEQSSIQDQAFRFAKKRARLRLSRSIGL